MKQFPKIYPVINKMKHCCWKDANHKQSKMSTVIYKNKKHDRQHNDDVCRTTYWRKSGRNSREWGPFRVTRCSNQTIKRRNDRELPGSVLPHCLTGKAQATWSHNIDKRENHGPFLPRFSAKSKKKNDGRNCYDGRGCYFLQFHN